MMVPKLFHRIWLGDKEMPHEFLKYGESWQKHHPNWTMKLWNEDNLPDLINQRYLDECNNYSEKSDLIRYELLYKYGGIYLDCDFECYKNIEPLIKDKSLFVSTENNHHLCGGFIGSIPQHPVIKRVISKIPRSLHLNKDKTSDLRIGPTFLTKTVRKNEIVVLKKEYFYPYLPGQRSHKRKLLEGKNNVAYAAHHWAGSWLE